MIKWVTHGEHFEEEQFAISSSKAITFTLSLSRVSAHHPIATTAITITINITITICHTTVAVAAVAAAVADVAITKAK